MTKVAVIAHAAKSFGGGLPELRRELKRQGVDDPLWIEVPKSRYAPKQVKRALDDDAELVFVWGGDGTVQRCIDAMAGSEAALAILPAGTANLLATNLEIPRDIGQAVSIGLSGERHKLDVGRFNGERFAVMAGAGFDASMIQQADGTLKDRLGRVAYVWTGSKNLRARSRSRRRSTSTACRGTKARRAASSSATSVGSSVASKCSKTRAPTTAGSKSASSTPTGSRTGCARWPEQQPDTRNDRRSSRRRRRRRSRSS
jgi:diacylglycerol kinase family enzyme